MVNDRHRLRPERLTGSSARIEDIKRTGRTSTAAQWSVASVVMIGSAASAGIGFDYLGEHWTIGVITGLGVDLALASGLVIGRRLRAVGVTTVWGTVLTWLTGVMTLCLNSGAAVVTGHYSLAVAHAFLPALLVVLCEAGSEAQLKLHSLAQSTAAAELAEGNARLAEENARFEADQLRIKAERDEEKKRQEQVREDRKRMDELAFTDRREEREMMDRQAVATLASVLAFGAMWKRRPKARPRTAPQSQPRRVPATVPPLVPSTRPTPLPVTDDLVARAQRLRTKLMSQGESAGRSVLQRELQRELGREVPERTVRELVRRLDERPLRAVGRS